MLHDSAWCRRLRQYLPTRNLSASVNGFFEAPPFKIREPGFHTLDQSCDVANLYRKMLDFSLGCLNWALHVQVQVSSMLSFMLSPVPILSQVPKPFLKPQIILMPVI